MSFDSLIEKIVRLQNPTVVGLDPRLEKIPAYIREKAFSRCEDGLEAAAAAIREFNFGLIDALCDVVPAVKPQCAFYEKYGWPGVRALRDTIRYANEKGLYVIIDGKRNDIGPTMEAYASAYLGEVEAGGKTYRPFGGDALTVNAYTGSDGVTPLLKVCEKYDKGIFVLVKTSNPTSGELQDRPCGGRPVYDVIGGLCREWGEKLPGKYGYNAVGAVVGATYPAQLSELRKKLKNTFFLVPGFGAQGGGASEVAPAFDQNGLGAIINSSRAVIYAYADRNGSDKDYGGAARDSALKMKEQITALTGPLTLEDNGEEKKS